MLRLFEMWLGGVWPGRAWPRGPWTGGVAAGAVHASVDNWAGVVTTLVRWVPRKRRISWVEGFSGWCWVWGAATGRAGWSDAPEPHSQGGFGVRSAFSQDP